MNSYQIVLACALMACTAALYVDYSKKPSDASTYADANTDQYKGGLYFDPSVKKYGTSYNVDSYTNQYNKGSQYNKDQYNNQYNKGQYNNEYNNDQYNNQYNNQYNKGSQYNKDQYNNQYNKGQYNNEYNNDQYNNQYNNQYNKGNQYNKDQYNNQYNKGNQYNKDSYANQYNKNYNYNAQGDYQQNNYDSTVGVYPCEKGDEGKKYEVIGACYAFYECVYGESLYRQCDDYYKFDAYSGKCVSDYSCLYVPAYVPSTYDGNSYNNYPNGKYPSYAKHSGY